MRLFVALTLPWEVEDALSHLQASLPAGHPVPAENLHLTLAFLGELTSREAEDVHDQLAGIRAAPVALTLAGVDRFGDARARSVHAGVEGNAALSHLQEKVARAARMAGVDLARRRFKPHVTIARLSGKRVEPRLDRWVAEHGLFRFGPFWVEDFALMRSDLGGGGPVYSDLATYPLDGEAAPAEAPLR
ncbi:MAG: RNA 2',3'-cyclic phosphodiesterase [Pseudomonadota bacterium]